MNWLYLNNHLKEYFISGNRNALMKKTSLIFTLLLLGTLWANGQGCIAIRSTGGTFIMSQEHKDLDSTSKWIFNANNRYFKSFRHFKGSVEQKQRQTQGTEVINHQYTLDLSMTHILKNSRWSIFLDIPILANSRSSLYEHHNVGRFLTHSFGMGDIRFAVYDWLINPKKYSRGNIQVGLGLKFPSGDYKYEDYFHTSDSTQALGPVDQSIQLGDGGTGITTEINAFYNLSHQVSLYTNLYYLLSPRDQNGVSTAREGTPPPSSVQNGSNVMSVPDQYMIRAGANITFNMLQVSVGFRDECLPVHDLIGGSDGFRRPGYILSVEPGLSYNINNSSFYGTFPIALYRDRTQSVPDKITTALTGIPTNGDAAFADYVINIGYSYSF